MRFKDDLQRYIYYHSTIDWCYYVIENLSKSNDSIHEVTDGVIKMLRYIIKTKPKLNFNTTEDRLKLKELLSFRKQLKKKDNEPKQH